MERVLTEAVRDRRREQAALFQRQAESIRHRVKVNEKAQAEAVKRRDQIDSNQQQLLNTRALFGYSEGAGKSKVGTAMPVEIQDSVLTIDEQEAYLKIAKSTLYKLVQEGKLPGQKVGRHWGFHRNSIDNWLQSSAETPVSLKHRPK
jgi:excisionase family DNA binding protein